MRNKIRFPSWNGTIAAGATIFAELPVGGPRLIGSTLQLSAGTGSKVWSDLIDERVMFVDGRPVITVKGSQEAYITEFNGSIYHKVLDTNKYYIKQHFAEPWRRDANSEDALAWGTAGLKSVQMQLKLAASLAETPLLTGTLETDDVLDAQGRQPGIGAIKRIEQVTAPFAAAGAFTFPVPMRRFPIHRIHVFSDKIDAAEVWFRGKSVWYATKRQAFSDQTAMGFNPSTSVFTIPFDITQRPQDFLPSHLPGEFKIEFTLASGVAASQVVFEGVGAPTD